MKKNLPFKYLSYLLITSGLGYYACKELSRPSRRKILKNQVVVITGASAGIGKALAYELAKEGCKLVLAARSTEKLEKISEELQSKYKSEILIVPTDVSNQSEAVNLIENSLDTFGYIDILINNAGIATYEFFYNENIENMKKVMDVNYWGMVNCTYSVLPSMISRNKGKIVNISSFAGKRGLPSYSNYAASKFAMNGFSESLRLEVKKYGINVIVVCPTSTKTDIVSTSLSNSALKINPDNFFGMSAERVARETVNAIVDNKREHIIGAGEKVILEINKVVPGFMDMAIKFFSKFIMKD